MNVKPYAKFIAALAGFFAVVAQATIDGNLSADDAGVIVTAALTAGAVFQVRNQDA